MNTCGSVIMGMMGSVKDAYNSPLGLLFTGVVVGVGFTIVKENIYLKPWWYKKQPGFDGDPTGSSPNTDRTVVIDGERVLEDRIKMFGRALVIINVGVGVGVTASSKYTDGAWGYGVLFYSSVFMVVNGMECLIGGFAGVINSHDKAEDLLSDERVKNINRICDLENRNAHLRSKNDNIRRENDDLRERVANGWTRHLIDLSQIEFFAPPNSRPGEQITIQTETGQFVRINLPDNVQPGQRVKIERPRQNVFTKKEIEDIMEGIFSIKEEMDDGRYLKMNNKLKEIHDSL